MKIYHGSYMPVETPRIINSLRTLDFGRGFYTTENLEQAWEWARKVVSRRKEGVPFVSSYEFDFKAAKESLRVQIFEKAEEPWLDYVCDCRAGRPGQDAFDIVYGPVADDDVYATLALYENKLLSKEETLRRLKIKKLFNQYLFHTEDALKYCSYINTEKMV